MSEWGNPWGSLFCDAEEAPESCPYIEPTRIPCPECLFMEEGNYTLSKNRLGVYFCENGHVYENSAELARWRAKYGQI